MSKRNIIIAALAAVFVIYAFASSTIVKEGHESDLTGEVSFDPATVVNNFWEQNAKTYFEKKAVDVNDLLNTAKGNLKSVAERGYAPNGESGALSFIVKGQGTVTEVKDKLRSGYLLLEPDDYKGEETFRIQIGPVYKGSAVRDTIDLISYKDYTNQIEWAQVSVALHEKIQNGIITPANVSSLLGKKIKYIGCFTVGSDKVLRITPVELTVVE
ncbi:MAG: DUF2291 domain-containing protein [Succinivibrio sp.]|nr:DUF2291 domain-containing protein [Succinivibrio sp.]